MSKCYGLTSFVITCLSVFSLLASSATVSLPDVQPVVTFYDVFNLVGTTSSATNVNIQFVQSEYLAGDNAAMGQVFTTGSAVDGYELTAISVQQVSFSTYWDYTGGTVSLQIFELGTQNAGGVWSITVLAAETATIGGEDDGITFSNGMPNPPRWLTFALSTPVHLNPNKQYGFQLGSSGTGSNDGFFIELNGTSSNAYVGGFAVNSGSNGVPETSAVWSGGTGWEPGDRVFVAHLSPNNGDLTVNGKVDLEDIAALSGGWQSLYSMDVLVQIASNWLSFDLPTFKTDPIVETSGHVGIAYSSTLIDNVTYYDSSMLIYSKVSGPAWLNVAVDGILSGTPAASDAGLNIFTIQIDDGINTPIQATLQITVNENVELLKAVPFTEVTFTDDFWLPRLQTNRQVTIPYIFDRLAGVYNSANNRIDNFAIAGQLMTGTPKYSFPFDDTDIYKTLEGASYSLMVSPDPALDTFLDGLIVKIAAAQEHNGYFPGYLYTIRTNGVDIWCGVTPWSNLSMSHELYDAGHLIESAIAHCQATGKTSLLNVAKKCANMLVDTFHVGGVEIPPGHEIVESALARLSEVTGEPNYLTLAKYYLDIRGTTTADHSPWGTYYQDTVPVVQQTEAIGHVVRAMYLYMGMSDVAARTSDIAYRDALMSALDSVWHSVFDTKAYVTGGLGAESGGESFGSAYNLPNNGYCETCAQIASVMWNERMFLYHHDGKYIDVLERTLYNSVTSGVSLKGDTFFYPNPLVSSGGYSRSPWFSCNCCIGNIARMIPSVPGYVYARSNNAIYVNLYVASTGIVPLPDNDVQLVQEGGYPWDGNMTITVNPQQSGPFTIYMRIPGWARNLPVPGDLYAYKTQNTETVTLDINGTSVPLNVQKGYVAVTRSWQTGDQIHLSLPMPICQVISHPSVAADVNRVALERGPIVYCAEWPDFDSSTVTHLYIPDGVTLTAEYRNNMLDDPTIVNKGNIITGTVKGVYATAGGGSVEQDEAFTAIPYYAWAHRGAGQMAVWLPMVSSLTVPAPAPTPSELVGYWTLDETSGTTAADTSGKGLEGTLMNGLSFNNDSVSGQVGRALDFDGTNDYIDLPDGFSDFVKGCTISLWVYPTAVKNWARFVDIGNGSASNNIWFGRRSSSNDLAFECWSGGSSNGLVTAANAISLNSWQMLTVTVDRLGNVKLFKNGQLIQTGTSKPSSVSRTNNYIGRSNWSADEYYQGYMDDIRIYNYNLSDADVQSLYIGQ